ncbi:beta-lactamase family protein [Brevibacterium casei]|uniref:CubicO group peptidase, beta-lactamase class C family n=2 Tax=Bacteria TaxID=2 RepID=A0A2H1K7F9_9MICO|nr:serine hydrolase domain-containing protein [Brevibacterium casei]MCT1445785.1 beta-lactamase family protein [Brevibacterium casei]MCT2181698.1 beta-lactamase family protein [Brevibacterium casei]MDH5149245.1 serine hydrolase [Brevibacterium casei]QPR40915.1 beta-lactamase family protein [Brevibacterium casei]QPR45071.1 beta-lactamase family protein [Brevibacterium casei]
MDEQAQAESMTIAPARPDLDVIADRLHRAERELSAVGGEMAFGIVVRNGPGHAEAKLTNPYRPFRIASMTKSFTAAVMGSLENGGLNYDYPMYFLVPDLKGTAVGELTARECLTMGTGFGRDDPWADRMESMSRFDFLTFLQRPLVPIAHPGTGFEYCNLGYALLGLAAESVTDRTFPEMVTTEVTGPLQMPRTGFDVADFPDLVPGLRIDRLGRAHRLTPTRPGAFSAIGGMVSTAHDICQWMTIHMDALDAEANTAPGAWSHVLAANQRPHRPIAVETSRLHTEEVHYGYGLMHRQDSRFGRVLCHSGGYPGYGSHMRWFPDLGFGIVVLGNTTYYPAERIVRDAVDAAWLTAIGRAEEIPRLRRDEPVTRASPVLERETAPAPTHPLPPGPRTGRTVLGAVAATLNWDDAFADAHFAVNMDLDEPRQERRERTAAWLESHRVDATRPVTVDDLTMETRLLGTVSVAEGAAITVRLDHLGDVQAITLSE